MNGLHLYKNLMGLLDKAGVPLDTRWRSLLLYLREINDYTHLSDAQKIVLQSLMTSIYSARDYSETNLHRTLISYRDCIVTPYQKKVDALLLEAGELIKEFQRTLGQRSADISELEETAVAIIEKDVDSQEQITQLREEFLRIKNFFSHDLRSLENLAHHDALTGLHNRRAFDEFMKAAIEEWLAVGRPLCLTLFDIDHFKNFNDTHGHRIGDQVLSVVGKQISKALNDFPADNKVFVARYGGEEFALVVSGKGVSLLPDITEIIRNNIKKFNLLIRDAEGNVLENGLHITVSAGIAGMSKNWNGAYLENLIDCADKALYHAKHEGRDQVVLFRHNEKETFAVVSPAR
jgi:diguanylate cyclase (GGDEF)-like protein